MKIIFAGTPELAKTILAAILAEGFSVSLVLTKVDSVANRGKKVTYSPVKVLALANNIEVLQIGSFKNNKGAIDILKKLAPDIIIVAAYGLILPCEVLSIPKLGCVNVHVSLLPHLRGAAPIARSIVQGDAYTGVTIMQMDAGLDTGDILLQQKVAIADKETSGSLHDKLAVLGAKLLINYLHNYKNISPIPQLASNAIATNTNNVSDLISGNSERGISYAAKIEKKEALINWHEDAIIIDRKIRAFNPMPGCFSYLDGKLVKIWKADIVTLFDSVDNIQCTDTSIIPSSNNYSLEKTSGTIIKADPSGILVKCGGVLGLRITLLQLESRNKQTASQFINGYINIEGKIFQDHG